MSDTPLATRAEKELDAFSSVRRRRPLLFWLIIGILILAFSWFIFDKVYGIPKLQNKIREQGEEINRLNLQLTPFRTVALEKFPGAAEGAALASLAKQLNQMQKDFEVAQGQITELKTKTGPRTITPEQRLNLLNALREGIKGPVIVQADWTDTEAKLYARQISSVLQEAGFDIQPVTLQILALILPGTSMFVTDMEKPPAHALSIQRGFMANGISILGDTVTPGMKRGIREDTKQNWEYDPNIVIIWVGQKP